MKCTGRSKVYILDGDGKRTKGDNGRFLIELDGDGKPLLRPCESDKAVRGTDPPVCRSHGGAAPQTRAKAAQRVVEQEALGALHRLGVQPVTDPLTALSQLAGQVLAFRDAIGDRVNALKEIRYESESGGEQLRSEVAVFERALDRCAVVLATIAKLNIDERLARISERQADAVVRAIDAGLLAGLTEAGVPTSGPAVTAARAAAARHLRAV